MIENSFFFILTIGCGLLCLGALGLIVLVIIILAVTRPSSSGQPPKAPPALSKTNSEPYLPPIHIAGGPGEWQQLLEVLNLELGDTVEKIEAKAYTMIQVIRGIEAAVYIPLWVLSEAGKLNAQGLDPDHPAARFSALCQQNAQAWDADSKSMRTACLEKGEDNSQSLECVITGIIEWLRRADELPAAFLLALQNSPPKLADNLQRLRPQIDRLIHLRTRLIQRDISWLAEVPRTTFVDVDEVQRRFSDHFRPLGQPVIIPREDIIQRRSGRLPVDRVTDVSYSFGHYRGFECIKFQVRVKTSSRPVKTNWLLLSTWLTIKLAPFVCEYCGFPVEGQSWTCSECGYDILYHATHPANENQV